MGKTLFKNMLASYVDKKNRRWDEQFGPLEVYKFKDQSKWPTSSLVLDLTLSGMSTLSFESFQADLNDYLNGRIDAFLLKYTQIVLKGQSGTAIARLQNLIDAIAANDEKVLFSIDLLLEWF